MRYRTKMTGWMGRVGACGANAMMQSFFSLLRKNVALLHQACCTADVPQRVSLWVGIDERQGGEPWLDDLRGRSH
jgi:transposase InsO family protein